MIGTTFSPLHVPLSEGYNAYLVAFLKEYWKYSIFLQRSDNIKALLSVEHQMRDLEVQYQDLISQGLQS